MEEEKKEGEAPVSAILDPAIPLEDQEVKSLIICKNKNKIESVKSYLEKRNWPTFIATDVNEAIKLMVEQKPHFVLISVNCENPKIKMLPNLLRQTFNATVIMFGEDLSMATTNKLKKSRQPNNWTNLISGPSIQRGFKKLMKANDQEEAEKDRSSSSSKSREEENIRVSGSAKDQKGNMRFSSDTEKGVNSIEGGENNQNEFNFHLKSGDEDQGYRANQEDDSSGGYRASESNSDSSEMDASTQIAQLEKALDEDAAADAEQESDNNLEQQKGSEGQDMEASSGFNKDEGADINSKEGSENSDPSLQSSENQDPSGLHSQKAEDLDKESGITEDSDKKDKDLNASTNQDQKASDSQSQTEKDKSKDSLEAQNKQDTLDKNKSQEPSSEENKNTANSQNQDSPQAKAEADSSKSSDPATEAQAKAAKDQAKKASEKEANNENQEDSKDQQQASDNAQSNESSNSDQKQGELSAKSSDNNSAENSTDEKSPLEETNHPEASASKDKNKKASKKAKPPMYPWEKKAKDNEPSDKKAEAELSAEEEANKNKEALAKEQAAKENQAKEELFGPQSELFQLLEKSLMKAFHMCGDQTFVMNSGQLVSPYIILKVERQGFLGYVALNTSRFPISDYFLETFSKYLGFLTKTYSFGEPFRVDIEGFDFAKLSQNEADIFIEKSTPADNLFLSCFESKSLKMDKTSPIDDKLAVELDHLDPEVKVRCSTYLYLQKNKKFYLYLNDGRNIMSNQKKRLQESEVKYLYINSDQIESFKNYFIEAQFLTIVSDLEKPGTEAA